MAQEFPSSPSPMIEPPRKRNTGLIVTIIVVLLLCCCLVAAGAIWYLWTYGDQIFGLTQILSPLASLPALQL